MIRQQLNQKMLQKLSPQQIQLMKLLQIPTATLDQRIKEELEANPALGEGNESEAEYENKTNDEETKNEDGEPIESDVREETYELDDYLSEYMEDDPSAYKYKASLISPDPEDKVIPVAVENSFHEYILEQLGMLELPEERLYKVAEQIIGSIDEDGYLRRDPQAIRDDLLFSMNIDATEDEIVWLLKRIQKFDPPGIAARDLQECLILQLQTKRTQALENDVSTDLKFIDDATVLLTRYFDEFSKKHYAKLQRHLGLDEQGLKETIQVILKLNPKPASSYAGNSSAKTYYVLPDFTIINRDGELDLTLNSRNAPDLRINERYKDMLRSYQKNKKKNKPGKKDKEAILFIKQKIDSAKWFIDAIKQRQQTMYKTMYAIMQYQYDFFLSGDEKKLKPMILKDIADITGLDISTVSRVANSKFVQTEFGTKRLKDFFSESIQTESGEEVSTFEVKKILREVIEEENKKKPLSDEKLKDILRNKGYHIARRTVAKYREQLNIPVARLRKEL